MMEVFRIAPTILYSGGAAYVAAKSIEEAIKTYCETEYRKYSYEDAACTCNHVTGMSYDTNTPCIIFDDIYIE